MTTPHPSRESSAPATIESPAEAAAGVFALVLIRSFFSMLAVLIGRVIAGTSLPADHLGVPALVLLLVVCVVVSWLSAGAFDLRRGLIAATLSWLLVAAVWSGYAASQLPTAELTGFYTRLAQRGPLDALLMAAAMVLPALVIHLVRRPSGQR